MAFVVFLWDVIRKERGGLDTGPPFHFFYSSSSHKKVPELAY